MWVGVDEEMQIPVPMSDGYLMWVDVDEEKGGRWAHAMGWA